MGYKIKIKNIPKDVTREYIEHAAPGKGRLIHEAGTRENDREISDMLFRTYGGNITTLKVENVNGRDLRTPDALWDGKYWEYKHVSTKTSIDDRMRAAWHQLRENARRKNMENEPVGLVVDISERRQGIEETLKVIEAVFMSKILYSADLIIKDNEEIIKILRKDKKK